MIGVVYIARCPEHGLHGGRTECFECGGPVEQVAMIEISALGEQLGERALFLPMPSPGFVDFTLAELVLIQEGLWLLGEQERVDHRLVVDWRGLVARLRSAVQQKVIDATEPAAPQPRAERPASETQ